MGLSKVSSLFSFEFHLESFTTTEVDQTTYKRGTIGPMNIILVEKLKS